jgi:CheY-like chemotaxis protein
MSFDVSIATSANIIRSRLATAIDTDPMADSDAAAIASRRLRGDLLPQILVVEDEPLVREFALDLLSSLGYAVLGAHDAISAMRLLEDTPSLDLIFTDIVMPGVDGIVLADMAIRRRPALKILYATGFRDLAGAKAKAGILHGKILEKPYRAADLRQEIERLLA